MRAFMSKGNMKRKFDDPEEIFNLFEVAQRSWLKGEKWFINITPKEEEAAINEKDYEAEDWWEEQYWEKKQWLARYLKKDVYDVERMESLPKYCRKFCAYSLKSSLYARDEKERIEYLYASYRYLLIATKEEKKTNKSFNYFRENFLKK